jgi:hypothetical protein
MKLGQGELRARNGPGCCWTLQTGALNTPCSRGYSALSSMGICEGIETRVRRSNMKPNIAIARVLGRAYLLTSRGKGTRAAGANFIGEGRV